MKLCPGCLAQIAAYKRAANAGLPRPPVRLCGGCRAQRAAYMRDYRARLVHVCRTCGSTRITTRTKEEAK